MLRKTFIFLFSMSLLAACVKPSSKSPVPVVEFVDFYAAQKSSGSDTASMILGYEDGDGDLFVTSNNEGPTVVVRPYFYNTETNSFRLFVKPPSDTFIIYQNVKQPADGYYKGRSIRGTITLPINEFRPSNSEKIFQFKAYLMDTKGNRSNTVSSPVYTVSF